MKTCGVCKRPYRGLGKLVYVSASSGLSRVRACSECVKLTVRLLVHPPTNWSSK